MGTLEYQVVNSKRVWIRHELVKIRIKSINVLVELEIQRLEKSISLWNQLTNQTKHVMM